MNLQKSKLEVCKAARKIASRAFVTALQDVLKKKAPVTEVGLRDEWLRQLRTYPEVFPDGWYIPPPYGIGILFSTDESVDRTNFPSLRPKKFWPRNDVFLDREKGIVLAYCSPVDRKTGIIGDFGANIYFGQKKIIKDHLRRVLSINYQIFEYAKIGIELSEVAKFTERLLAKYGLVNRVTSLTDPSGLTDFGHTVPFSYEEMSEKERELLNSGTGDWEKICLLISERRRFVNIVEKLIIQFPMAFTVEPRSTAAGKPEVPTAFFHTTILFEEKGKKELLTDFDKIFKIAGMDYML